MLFVQVSRALAETGVYGLVKSCGQPGYDFSYQKALGASRKENKSIEGLTDALGGSGPLRALLNLKLPIEGEIALRLAT